jgi:hypothetical protein
MHPDLRDTLVVNSRLRYLEEWISFLEGSQLSAEQRREKAKEKGLPDDIIALRDELTEGWKHLLPPGGTRPPNATITDSGWADADVAVAQLGLMRRLLTIEERLARACGESVSRQPVDLSAGLDALATDPGRALPLLARAEPAADIDRRIRRLVGRGRASWRSRAFLLIGIALIGVIILCGGRTLLRAMTAGAPILTPTAIPPTAMTAGAPILTPTAIPPTATAVGQPSGVAPTNSAAVAVVAPILPVSTTTPSAQAVTAEPRATEQLTTPPPTMSSVPINTPEPTTTHQPTATALPAPPPTRRPTAIPRHVFVVEVPISFPGLPDSNERRSCVNGQVINRGGSGIKGAILRVNNGVSQSEQKATNAEGFFEFCGLGASRWSVVLGYVPGPPLTKEVVAVIEVSGQEGQYARVLFRER